MIYHTDRPRRRTAPAIRNDMGTERHWVMAPRGALTDSSCDPKPFTVKTVEAFCEKHDRGERTGGKRNED